MLGDSDRLDWPDFGSTPTLRLRLEDIYAPSRGWSPPSPEHISELIEFARGWNGIGALLVHCRAGSSRSPAAGMIAAAALGRADSPALAMRVRIAKAYFRPSETMLKARCWSITGPARTGPDPHGPVGPRSDTPDHAQPILTLR